MALRGGREVELAAAWAAGGVGSAPRQGDGLLLAAGGERPLAVAHLSRLLAGQRLRVAHEHQATLGGKGKETSGALREMTSSQLRGC